MTETPANTPNPIGNTSSFFPGGSKGAAAPTFSEVAVGERDGDEEDEERGKGDDEDCGKAIIDEPVLSGCGVAVGFGTEEIPYKELWEGGYSVTMIRLTMTTTGTPEDGTTTLLLPVLLETES